MEIGDEQDQRRSDAEIDKIGERVRALRRSAMSPSGRGRSARSALSSTPAPAIAITAQSIEPSMTRRIAVNPRQSASSVTMFGRSSRSGTRWKPRRRGRLGLQRFERAIGLVHWRQLPLERARLAIGRDMRDHGLAGDCPRLEADHDLRADRRGTRRPASRSGSARSARLRSDARPHG